MKRTHIPLKNEKRDRLFLLAAGLLILLCILLLVVHRVGSARIRAEIRTELRPITDTLLDQTGGDRVDIRFAVDPGQRFTLSPGKVKHQVFLTVHCSSLKAKSNAQWLALLLGERGAASVCHSYDSRVWNSALYARSVQVPSSAMSYPVFVTITDGASSLSLLRISMGRTDLDNADLWTRLQPIDSLPGTGLLGLLIFLSCAALAVLLYLWAERRKVLDGSCTDFYKNCADQGVRALDGQSAETKAAALAGTYAQRAGVVSVEESWRAMFERGRALCGADAPAEQAEPGSSPIAHILQAVDAELREQQLRSRQEARRRALTIGGSVAAVLVLAAILIAQLVLRPAHRYSEAMALRETGKDSEAYAILTELGSYKDARELVLDYDYLDAIGYLSDGQYVKAYLLLSRMGDHPSAAQERERLLQERPFLAILDAEPGETCVLGRYEQDNDLTNGPEDLEWIVISKTGDVVMAVSKDILDAKTFDGLMSWLRGPFADEVFEGVEPGFVSAVGLLTREDLKNFSNHAGLKPDWTPYAMAQRPERHYYAGLSWWLTSETIPVKGSMYVVTNTGAYQGNTCEMKYRNGVRPCIIIDASGTVGDPYDKEPVAPVVHAHSSSGGSSSGSSNSGRRVCYRCNGTGRVVLHYGNRWNKIEGYGYGDVCGLCGGTGYLDN